MKRKGAKPAPRREIEPLKSWRVANTETQPAAEFGRVEPYVLSRTQGMGPCVPGYLCTGAWDIQHPPEKVESFNLLAERWGNRKELYHGTHAHYIRDIAQQGLRPGRKDCMFGPGVYLGEADKAFNYASGRKARYIIKVDAVLGEVLTAKKAFGYDLSKVRAEGCHSVLGQAGVTQSWGGYLSLSEYVVYSSNQVLPRAVYEYQSEFHTYHSGACALRVKSTGPARQGHSAFRDILDWKRCGAKATRRLQVGGDTDPLWVCDTCIAQNSLKEGMQITARINGRDYVHRIKRGV